MAANLTEETAERQAADLTLEADIEAAEHARESGDSRNIQAIRLLLGNLQTELAKITDPNTSDFIDAPTLRQVYYKELNINAGGGAGTPVDLEYDITLGDWILFDVRDNNAAARSWGGTWQNVKHLLQQNSQFLHAYDNDYCRIDYTQAGLALGQFNLIQAGRALALESVTIFKLI